MFWRRRKPRVIRYILWPFTDQENEGTVDARDYRDAYRKIPLWQDKREIPHIIVLDSNDGRALDDFDLRQNDQAIFEFGYLVKDESGMARSAITYSRSARILWKRLQEEGFTSLRVIDITLCT